MKKEVGIITFHKAHNYGALLQAYGLSKKLSALGYAPYFLEDPEDIIQKKYEFYPTLKGRSLLGYIKAWLLLTNQFGKKKNKADLFDKFIRDYLPTRVLKKHSNEIDRIVIGSDQVWNFNITHGIKGFYFGEKDNLISKKVISYAASMGNGMEKKNFNNEFKSKLANIDCLGVREKSLAEQLNLQFNLKAVVNLDPTLLLDKSDWDLLCNDRKNDEDYILVYEVEKNSETIKVVECMKKQLKISKVVKINSRLDKATIDEEVVSPNEFLTLFKNAKFVVTTSFHGTVFSVINEVPFYTIKFGNGIDLRSAGLLDSIGLQSRHISSSDDISINKPDFINSKQLLMSLKKLSEDYLLSSLG